MSYASSRSLEFSASSASSASGTDVLTSELLRSSLELPRDKSAFISGRTEATKGTETPICPLNYPSSEQQTPTRSTARPTSVQPSPKNRSQNSAARSSATTPPLERLAAETDSSVSVAASIPYYNLSEYSRSFNTVNLLRSNASAGSRASRRLAFPNADSPSTTKSPNGNSSQPQPHHESVAQLSEQFNQVPPRFSQFILDQDATTAPRSSNSSEPAGGLRQVSSQIGSSATIFSTRPESTLRHRQRQAQSNSNVVNDPASSLRRRRAIRFKEGGPLYRIRLALRRLVLKVKKGFLPIRNFFVGHRKATSNVKFASGREASLSTRQHSLKRSRSASRAKARSGLISAPLANPELGSASGASRVGGLTSELKAFAGARVDQQVPQNQNAAYQNQEYQNNPGIDNVGKLSHLSNYIAEQRDLSGVALPRSVISETSSAPLPPPHTDSSFQKSLVRTPDRKREELINVWRSYLANVISQRIRLRQEIYLFQSILARKPLNVGIHSQDADTSAQTFGHSDNHRYSKATQTTAARSSRRWSESVGEIVSYNASIVHPTHASTLSSPGSASGVLKGVPEAHDAQIDVASQYTNSTTKRRTQSVAASSQTIEDASSFSSDTDDDSSDENITKLQQALNRRSMLGDMLDYDSEDEDTLSMESSSMPEVPVREFSPSRNSRSNSELVKRYGTIRRRNTEKSSYYGSSACSSKYSNSSIEVASLSRSPGFNDLHIMSE